MEVEGGDPETTQARLLSSIYLCYELLGICSEALQQRFGSQGRSTEAAASGQSKRQGQKQKQQRRRHPGGGLGGAKRVQRDFSEDRIARSSELTALDSVAMRLRLLTAVSPGSYQHAELSARLLAKTRQLMGLKAPETQVQLE